MAPERDTPLTSVAALLLGSLVLAGCASTAAHSETPTTTVAKASTTLPASSSPTPAVATPTAGPSTAPATASPLPSRQPLRFSPVTTLARATRPATMVTPTCPRPPIVMGGTPWSPAGDPGVQWPEDRRVQAGTNHAPVAKEYAHPASQVVAWMTHKAPQPRQKLAFLTFDDGPNGVTTPRILQILREQQVPATFFVVASQVNDTTAAVLREQVAEGHAVAIHSYGHTYGYLYPGRQTSPANLGCDIDWATAAVRGALGTGYHTTAYRYPGGHGSWRGTAASDAMLKQRGLTWVDWNSMNGDADSTVPHGSPADMVANVPRTARMNGAADGDVLVVLMHDFHPNHLTPESLAPIITDLKKRGYEFGVIS